MDDLNNGLWVSAGRTTLLLWLTSWMGAFLVIVDNKTDLWVMALSLLALLAGLIFIQNKINSTDRKELVKYIIIAGLMFGFATMCKVTAFVDFTLFWLFLVALWMSPVMSLWLWVMVMWLVRKFNILTSYIMLSNSAATWLIIAWIIITIVWLLLIITKREKRKSFGSTLANLVIFWISFIVPIILLKLPRTVYSQIKTDSFSITNSVKSTFLWMNKQNTHVLIAQNLDNAVDNLESQIIVDNSEINNHESFNQCISAWNIYSETELKEDLKEVIWDWWAEDFWRYIWYWWKEFTKDNLKIYWLLKLLWPESSSCYWLNHDAKMLCENSNVIDSFKIDDLRAIYENWIKNKESEAWIELKNAIDAYDQAKKEWKISFFNPNTSLFRSEIVALRQYYQSHTIRSESEALYIPYRYIVPLNISFNRSLQNLSSYYTDIGFIWIVLYIFLLIALPYAILKKDKLLTAIALTTIMWWIIWWIIGSAILWYGTVLISWTMVTLAVFFDRFFNNKSRENKPFIIPALLIIVITICCLTQIVLNLLRISSQWASSVFVWYKTNVWKENILDDNLQYQTKVKYWYWWKDIFDLQFPQYNWIIHKLANRKDNEWVTVAWTYIQYFLDNQWNLKTDSMLEDFRVNASDWDLCKTYRRLKNNNTRYLIIDPNIGTVSMWEWNESLFYRFFWKLNTNETQIETDGTITMLVRLAREWYLKLISTNNLWTKYALTVDDDMIKEYFWNHLTSEQLILTRWKMAVLQYFWDADSIFWAISNMFITRIMNDPESGIQDIADIYWFEVDSKKVAAVVPVYINRQASNDLISELTQDEKIVLINYLNIYLAYSQWDTENARWMIQSLLSSSVVSWSQVIALELNE